MRVALSKSRDKFRRKVPKFSHYFKIQFPLVPQFFDNKLYTVVSIINDTDQC